ncbi:hypothetical protein B0H19DRAFT_1153231 [Mycena capillaripes]|nr:hypothetical protein B0H19DRAFT_1153231 [Mycena capillaripes]
MSDGQQSDTNCPALTLPVEITSEIFLRCIDASASISLEDKPSNPLDNPPILLTKICRDWRLIALSTPQLWSRVYLEFGGKHGLRTGYIDSWWVSFLETWLSRAHHQPLTVVISNLNHPDPHEALVGLLDRHRHRWEDVTLKLPFHRFYQFSPHGSNPMLRRLSVDSHSIPRVVETQIATFQLAPLLDHVCLGGWGLRPSHFILPWEQLTTLELSTASLSDCLECLRRAPKLVNCAFDIQESAHDPSLSPVPALLCLRSLTLSGAAPSAIFPYTVIPGLEELDIAGRSLNAGDLSRIAFFVSRSRCQLRRLRLYFISDALATSAIQLLQTLPSLERLELAATEAKTIILLFTALCNEPFLPQLQSLSLSHHKMYDSIMHAMFQHVANVLARRESQTPEHVRLLTFSLFVQYDDTSPRLWVQRQLKELVDRGMSLDVRNRHERWI